MNTKSSAENIPTEHEANCLAAFVEAADELLREAFFSLDDKSGISIKGDTKTAKFGDRSHFRSALITFRRMWMNDEASNFQYICNVLKRFENDGVRSYIETYIQPNFKAHTETMFFIQISGKDLINLWLNSVFAHTNIKNSGGRPGRIEFEKAAKQFGVTFLEFHCRMTVKMVANCFFEILPLVSSALERWESAYGVKPAFEIGAPFGKEKVELNSDGFLVSRIASTEHSHNESEQEKMLRILGRDTFSQLYNILDKMSISKDGLVDSFRNSSSYEILLNCLGYRIKVDDNITANGFYAQMGEGGITAIIPSGSYLGITDLLTAIHADRIIFTTTKTVKHFDKLLNRLRKTLGYIS